VGGGRESSQPSPQVIRALSITASAVLYQSESMMLTVFQHLLVMIEALKISDFTAKNIYVQFVKLSKFIKT